MLIGRAYIISFDISNDEVDVPHLFSLWLYYEDAYDQGLGVFNAKFVDDIRVVEGQFKMDYTVIDGNRERFGIRARNDYGGKFTVSNISIIEKL
jgi:hypothetical protein